ncbi:MAG: amidohydrolase family protein [Ignavibacteriales bacterium]|nr:amidohydrolase family protein [Ignavibacteriales bacterium]
MNRVGAVLLIILLLLLHVSVFSQQERRTVPKAPPRVEGEGSFDRLIIRGVTIIDGTGSPPYGPADIVVEKNRITGVRNVGVPGLPIDPHRRLKAEPEDKILDCEGMYLLPGLVDMHGHVGGVEQGTPSEYVFKLWLGHGITTIRDPGSGNGLDWMLEHKQKSERNEITAPRMKVYVGFGGGAKPPIASPEQARAWVREAGKKGAEGFKFFGTRPDIFVAALEEAKRMGLRTACHHAQLGVARMNVLQTARAGLTTMEHWYGLPEALFTDRTVQDFPPDYNYSDEQQRFGEAGKLWKQAAPPFSPKWNQVMNELLSLDFTIDPTFSIYEASRDLMKEYRAEWHDAYTLPSLWEFYKPNRDAHGSYWFYWTTEDEVAWKENYRLWMTFVNEFKNRGGRVTVGSDAGYIYKLYGFAYVRELEMLREAGFHPLEVIRSATLYGAQALGMDKEIGSIETGKLADMIILEENPLQNLKALYGTGALKVNDENEPVRVGGVRYVIKDGIIFDAKKLLADVRRIVTDAKKERGYRISVPGTSGIATEKEIVIKP